MSKWTPNSWQSYPYAHMPQFDVSKQTETLSTKPPLVFSGEINHLKNLLQEDVFILQGGDCAERFIDCRSELIINKLKILLRMAAIIQSSIPKKVIPIARMAGQYGKPRSKKYEPDGKTLNYHGDIVHDIVERSLDPKRMIEAYHCASSTINFLRSAMSGGFGNVPAHWTIRNQTQLDDKKLNEDIHFNTLFTSHEAIFLPYEEALTRRSPLDDKFYNLSAHFLWLGYRTYHPHGAHVEYLSGIENPVAIKVGPKTDINLLKETLEILNSDNRPGKIVLISRFGVSDIENQLPRFIEKLLDFNVKWMLDPMHGNTIQNGVKTRRFHDIALEIRLASQIHGSTPLSGLHFEMTSENVTECMDESITGEDLLKNYQSYCDPRLNFNQSLRVAHEVANIANSIGQQGSQIICKQEEHATPSPIN